MPHVRREEGQPGLDITAVAIPGQEAMDCEAVTSVMQARPALPGGSAYARSAGDSQEGGDDYRVRARATPLVDEEGRFWISAVAIPAPRVNIRAESVSHICFQR